MHCLTLLLTELLFFAPASFMQIELVQTFPSRGVQIGTPAMRLDQAQNDQYDNPSDSRGNGQRSCCRYNGIFHVLGSGLPK